MCQIRMFCGGVVVILGAVIAATSMSIGQIVAARFILGGGIAIMTVGAPAVSTSLIDSCIVPPAVQV